MTFPSSETDDDSPSPSSSRFPNFTDLPPEIRHQIWQAAIPTPGINFFNVHSFPRDHAGANRSTSPPWLYLDLRRLDIADDDDAVAEYDPSAWQARDALRRMCREARSVCAIPDSKAAAVTLTRPKRGLYVRAGDGQLLRHTPLAGDSQGRAPQVRRTVWVHTDDVLCLSVENCSFNLPYEELPLLRGGGNVDTDEEDDDDDDDMGWAYDPQLTPPLPSSVPVDRCCINMARGNRVALHAVNEVTSGLISSVPYTVPPRWLERQKQMLVMFDALTRELGKRSIDELTPATDVFWDRFGDCYLPLPWESDDLQARYRLTKIWPESNDIRDRYLRSALLQSPKRPA